MRRTEAGGESEVVALLQGGAGRLSWASGAPKGLLKERDAAGSWRQGLRHHHAAGPSAHG